jgi:NAD(P)-dependent dehydrogenase (short-subunit alcohol dehydrogenase family)
VETQLKGKNVFVTDAGTPLGRSCALAFAREGAGLLLSSPEESTEFTGTRKEADALGVKTVAGTYKDADLVGIDQFVRDGLDQLGHIDVLVNTATAHAVQQSFAATSFDAWKESTHLVLTGSILLCRAVLPGMIQQNWGRLIHFVGLNGFVGGAIATSTTHMGLVGLTRGMASQYGKFRITANCIGYGGVDAVDGFPDAYPPAKLNDPLNRLGTVQELSSAAVYLASEAAGYISGQCYLVNGGKYFL